MLISESQREAPPRADAASGPTGRVFAGRAMWCALVIFVAAVGYRLYLIFQGSPALGGDESVIGLMALNISRGEDFPVFFYGQHYMGPAEAYLAAPLVALLGPGLAALRLATLLFYAGFYWAMYWLVRRTFSPGLAVLTCVALALGSDRVLRQELVANGGWSEMFMLGALIAGLTSWLCTRRARGEMWLYGLWGLLAGLCLWASVMIMPFLCGFGLVLLIFRGRLLLWRRGLLLVAGGLLGLLPLIVHNLRLEHPKQGTIHDILAYNPDSAQFVLLDHLNGMVHGIALATGMCDFHCTSWQLRWWPVTYVLLLAAAMTAAAVALWRLRAKGERAVPYAILLALGVGAVGTLLLFFQSAHSGMPRGVTWLVWETSRYLSNLLLAVPVVLWPLWWLATKARPQADRARTVAVLLLAAMALTAGSATVSTLTDGLSTERRIQARHTAFKAELERRGVTRLYVDYFSCHKLIYTTGERILCAPIVWTLEPGVPRWQPYIDTLAAEPLPYYAFDTGDIGDTAFRDLLRDKGITADEFTVAGYTVYHPARHPGVPAPARP